MILEDILTHTTKAVTVKVKDANLRPERHLTVSQNFLSSPFTAQQLLIFTAYQTQFDSHCNSIHREHQDTQTGRSAKQPLLLATQARLLHANH